MDHDTLVNSTSAKILSSFSHTGMIGVFVIANRLKDSLDYKCLSFGPIHLFVTVCSCNQMGLLHILPTTLSHSVHATIPSIPDSLNLQGYFHLSFLSCSQSLPCCACYIFLINLVLLEVNSADV